MLILDRGTGQRNSRTKSMGINSHDLLSNILRLLHNCEIATVLRLLHNCEIATQF